MKTLYAAAFALVVWRLMIPSAGSNAILIAAPLSEWTLSASYDSAESCESVLTALKNDAFTQAQYDCLSDRSRANLCHADVQVAALLAHNPASDIGTLATVVESLEELLDPNVVKVVTDIHGMALYFSRAPIPWNCDSAPLGLSSQSNFAGARRHRGIYAYRVASLLRFAQLPHGTLEQREKLEQLRALEHGLRIHVEEALERPGPDVNTLADLERVRALIASTGHNG